MKSRNHSVIIKKPVINIDRKLQTPSPSDLPRVKYQEFTSKRNFMYRAALYKNVSFALHKSNQPRSISPSFNIPTGRKLFKNDYIYDKSSQRILSNPLSRFINRPLTREIRKPYVYARKTKPKLTSSKSALIKQDDTNSFITLNSRSITPNPTYTTHRFTENNTASDFEEVALINQKEKDTKVEKLIKVLNKQPRRRHSQKKSYLNEEMQDSGLTYEYERDSSFQSNLSLNILVPRLSPVNDSKINIPIQKLINRLKEKKITEKRVLLTKLK